MHNVDEAPRDVVLVLTTWPGDGGGSEVARQLVETRLAACVTRLPQHRVVYHWKDAIEEAEEQQWVIKTTRGSLAALWHAVRTAHPYDTPEWIVIEATGGSDAYLRWVVESTTRTTGTADSKGSRTGERKR